MATIMESLKSGSGYPVPRETLADVAVRRGLSPDEEATREVMESEAYRLAKADLMVWVSFAPNVQENGVSFDLLFSDRTLLREKANRVYGELGDEAFTQEAKSKFGYVGSRL